METSWRLQLDRPAIVSTLGLEPTRWKRRPKLPRVFPNTGGPHPVGNMPETKKDIAILMAQVFKKGTKLFPGISLVLAPFGQFPKQLVMTKSTILSTRVSKTHICDLQGIPFLLKPSQLN